VDRRVKPVIDAPAQQNGHTARIMRAKSTPHAPPLCKGYASVCQKGPFAHTSIVTVFQTQIVGTK
jgi:hypothetical protein